MGGFFESVAGFLTHPLTLALGGFAAFCLVVLWALNNVRVGKPKPWRPTGTPWLNAVFAAAIGLSPILAVLFVAVLAMLVMVGWQMFSGDMIAKDPANLRWYALSFVALLTALGGIIGTPLAIIRIWNSERQTSTQEEALFNEKINAAAQGLAARRQVTRVVGHGAQKKVLTEWQDDLVTRNAAIDRLEGLVHERPEAASRIASLLSVYVVELSQEDQNRPVSAPDGATGDDLRKWASDLTRKRSDMEKAAQTLGRLLEIDGNTMPGSTINLRGANLQGFDLRAVNFKGALLGAAHLEGTKLGEAHLERANLRGAHLEGAKLTVAHLEGTDLTGAHLVGANVWEAHLERAILIEAHLEAAYLRGTHLVDANLMGANLGEAILRKGNLKRANLAAAHLMGANLIEAHLEQADLRGANLVRADLRGAHLEGTILKDARLEEADLTKTHLRFANSLAVDALRGARVRDASWESVKISQDQVNSMFGDASVTLPPAISRPDHWPNTSLGSQEFAEEYQNWRTNPASYTPPQNRS